LLKRDPGLLSEVVARCCEIKAEVVAEDETETGLRAILNFVHTIGHAIEATAGYGKYFHGEAISIGQVAAADISTEVTGLSRPESRRVESLFRRAGLPTRKQFSTPETTRLLAAMRLDKKVSGGEVKFVLARKIGRVEPGHKVSEALIRSVLAKRTGSKE
jgi:3-dehydroquinate synthase